MTAIEPPSTSRSIHPTRFCVLLVLLLPIAVQAAQPTGWKLIWSDEFNGPNNAAPDPTKWSFETGGGGFGNNELETYTSHPVNARQHDGSLVITARKEDFTGADGVLRHYTSARINSKGLFSQTYGRFEARMKLPASKGIWPAFWLLGNDIDSAGWPQCGEIDIMENIGAPSTIYSTLHGPGYSGKNAISATYPLPQNQAVDTGFHLYAVEWAPKDIEFFFDGKLIAHRTPADLPAGAKWVYDHPFFIILNLAVGGNWPGSPDATAAFPQQMLVDYVRVYSRTPLTPAVNQANRATDTAVRDQPHDHD